MRLDYFGANRVRLIIEDSEFYFSYNTCVAVRNKYGEFRIESPSVTTTRHMRLMGVSRWFLISEEELSKYFPVIIPLCTSTSTPSKKGTKPD